MKKALVLMALILLLCLAACGEAQQEGMPNPWHDISETEAAELCPASFVVPEGAENAAWSVMTDGTDAPPLVQLTFDLDGNSFTAREQATNDRDADIAGMYYDWTDEREDELQSWGLPCKACRSVGDEGYADLCTWYDEASGTSYSLSVTAEDLDGFDILAVAEALAPIK